VVHRAPALEGRLLSLRTGIQLGSYHKNKVRGLMHQLPASDPPTAFLPIRAVNVTEAYDDYLRPGAVVGRAR